MGGAIVTKDAGGTVNVTKLGHNDLLPSWFLVETNYDIWDRPPADDDRRDAAIKSMNLIGQSNFTTDALFKVLSTPPVFNQDTTYTTVMQTSTSYYSTMVRYDAPGKSVASLTAIIDESQRPK